MNILVPHSWLLDYIRTNASKEDIARALSLHAFSVERIESVGDDVVYEIEVTPNRGDGLSVLGIARELLAILGRLGFEVEWIYNPAFKEQQGSKDMVDVVIDAKSLIPRFSAVVLSDVEIKDSPSLIQDRLEMVGIRPINNVVDITNYLMIDKGQPMHAFDYDKIGGQKMILRESREGEKLTTLDGVERVLPAGGIVIEDGEGKLIDLCGLMGCANSEVDGNTKRVLLFVQIYDPQRVRRVSMTLGHRTDAALRFEKGVDFDGVLPALWEAVDLIVTHSDCNVSSKLTDIVNKTPASIEVPIDYERINEVAGVSITTDEIDQILSDLGFDVSSKVAKVPSWRVGDIEMPEDLAEEVIRIYGFENLPNVIPEGSLPFRELPDVFRWEIVAKNYLKYQGFFECYTYSATSKENVSEKCVPVKNPLTEDFAFMRTSLVPQLLEVLNRNKGYSDVIRLFEMAPVYEPVAGDIPNQPVLLAFATRGVTYRDFKGYVEGLYEELGVDKEVFGITEHGNGILSIELNFENLAVGATALRAYVPLTGYNSIKEDMTFVINEDVTFDQIRSLISSVDQRVLSVEFGDLYDNNLTLAIEYLDREKQISSEDTQKIREEIFLRVSTDLGIELKG